MQLFGILCALVALGFLLEYWNKQQQRKHDLRLAELAAAQVPQCPPTQWSRPGEWSSSSTTERRESGS